VIGDQMMKKVVAFVVLLAITLASSSPLTHISIGDRLLREYTKYIPMATTVSNATASGWMAAGNGQCDPDLGVAYNYQTGAPSKSAPITLFFTSAGQLSGVGMTLNGEAPSNLVPEYWQPAGDSQYFLSVTFRNSSVMCTGNTDPSLPLGDRLVINANGVALEVPLLEQEAYNNEWTKGACFYSMGYHWFYDLSSAPNMSWSAANLLPIVPMYSGGVINAFFFASPVVQQSLFNSNMWDPIALLDALMCKNWCDTACTFSDTSFWSTGHMYLRDYTQATCSNGCTLHCDCPSSDLADIQWAH